MSFNTKGLMSSIDQTWRTPKKIYDYYIRNGFFDVCQGIDKFDGLNIDWPNVVFCNPPYKDINKWVDKGINECKFGNCQVVVYLIPCRTDTQWFKKLFLNGAIFCFIEGRLKFNDSKYAAPFPSMFVRLCSYGMEQYFSDFRYYSKDKMIDIYDYKY